MNTNHTNWTRICPGEYESADGTWRISRINYGYGPEWTARETAKNGAVIDPLPTLARAKAAAQAAAQENAAQENAAQENNKMNIPPTPTTATVTVTLRKDEAAALVRLARHAAVLIQDGEILDNTETREQASMARGTVEHALVTEHGYKYSDFNTDLRA